MSHRSLGAPPRAVAGSSHPSSLTPAVRCNTNKSDGDLGLAVQPPRGEEWICSGSFLRQPGKRRSGRPTSAKPGDDRIGYELVVPITIPDRRELEERARKELRSLSSYVAKLIVEDLAAGR